MSATVSSSASQGSERPAGLAGILVLTVVFAVLYGLAEFAAISNLIALPEWYEILGISESTPWLLLILGVAIPVLFYAAALLLGRRRTLFARTLVFGAGLGITHALSLSLFVAVSLLQPALT